VYGRTPIDTAIMCGHFDLITCLPESIKNHFPEAITAAAAAAAGEKTAHAVPGPTTAIISHPFCRMHYTCPPSATEELSAPPENFRRLSVVIDEQHGALRSADIEHNVVFVEECRKAALTDVLRVHEWTYVRRLQSLCQGIDWP
jgi:hypothetical protein